MERKGHPRVCSVEIQQIAFPLGLTKGILCAKVVCVIVLVKQFHPLQEDQSSLASEGLHWILKRRILRSAGEKLCSRKYKVIAIDVEGKAGTSFIRELTESRYIPPNVYFVN